MCAHVTCDMWHWSSSVVGGVIRHTCCVCWPRWVFVRMCVCVCHGMDVYDVGIGKTVAAESKTIIETDHL